MTPKQKRFADEYIIDLNATQAATRAGYSEKTAGQIGEQILKKLEIQDYINSRLEEIQTEKTADAQEVMEYLTSVLRGESRSEVVVIENIGDYMSEARRIKKAPDEKERLKAAELLGRRYTLFSDKTKIDGVVPIVIRDDLGDDDL